MANKLNKTETLPIRMTPKLKTSIIKCATQLGVKPTDWVRGILANAVQVQCLRPNGEQPQEQAK